MYLRINGLVVSPSPAYGAREVSFGRSGDPARQFSAVIRAYGTGATAALADVDMRAKLAALAVQLGQPTITVIARTADSLGPDAIALTCRGRQPWEAPYTPLNEGRHFVDVLVTLTVNPHTTPANRVFLAGPIGDDFPNSADVVANDEDKAFADGGRYAITAKTGDTYGTLTLYGDCIATELLVVENQYCNVSPAAATFVGELTWLAAGGGAVGTEIKQIAWATAAGAVMTPNFHKAIYRVPATAVRFRIVYYFSAGIAGDALAYVWGVYVGRQAHACPMTPPHNFFSTHQGEDQWEHTTWPEHEFSRTTTGNCAWTHDTHYTIATCTHNAAQANLASLYAHPVVPNRRFGIRCRNQCTFRDSGTAYVMVWWYDQDLNYLNASIIRTVVAVDGAVVETFAEVVVPEYAFFAVPGGAVVADSHMTMKWSAIQFGPHVSETPDDIPLSTIPGEFPAPIELWGDVDVVASSHGGVGTDAHAAYVGCGPNDRCIWVVEAEALAGFGAAYVDALAYPSGGGNNAIHAHEVLQHGHINTTAITPGTYELLARVHANATHTGTFGVSFDNGVTIAKSITSALNTWEWRSLGQVKIPSNRTRPGVTADIVVTAVAEVAAGEARVDRYAFIPVSFGGWAFFHHLVAADDVSDFDIVDEMILLEGYTAYSHCSGGTILATKSDELRVVADMVAATEITHAIILAPLCTPRYSLWR